MSDNSRSAHGPDLPPEPTGIVSVNSRGGESSGLVFKIAFVLLVLGLLGIGGLFGYNKHAAARDAIANVQASAETTEKQRPAAAARRVFDTDPPVPTANKPVDAPISVPGTCPEGELAKPLLGQDGKPLPAPNGQPLHVCANGQVIMPGLEPTVPRPVPAVTPQAAPVPALAGKSGPSTSRYGGDILLAQSHSVRDERPSTGFQTAHALSPGEPFHSTFIQSDPVSAGSGAATPSKQAQTNPHGPIANLLRTESPDRMAATMIGDRNMILPQGRSIDCNLTVRIINEVSGKATCVLSSHAYSDNGRVVLAERGSVVTGEYVAQMAQGQRRLFVLWTRLQTPKGVVINIDSPGADSLGTTGLPGNVENRWRERIGAAVLLSLVEDAIGYQTAKAGAEGGVQGIAVLQHSTQTSKSLAERILDSTINIKPTLYKNQGDRATIFVSRDLDFGAVYALRAN
jgi:type IV secretion system protein VirB10